jgi:hypothetical protein
VPWRKFFAEFSPEPHETIRNDIKIRELLSRTFGISLTP